MVSPFAMLNRTVCRHREIGCGIMPTPMLLGAPTLVQNGVKAALQGFGF
jgi:hypothetical protein